MKKSMCILIFSAVLLTGCGGTETMKTAIPEVTTEIVPVTETARTEAAVTTVMTARPLETTVATATVTTARIAKTALISETKAVCPAAQDSNEISQITTEKPQGNTIAMQEATPEIVRNPAVTTVPVQTTATPKSTTTVQTTIITTTTVPEQSEEEKLMEIGRNLPHDGTDYGKALVVYDYMIANGSGTCVNYAYRTYCICKGIGLECYFAWTAAQLYGHVANVVKIDGMWFVLDTQAGCFLTENLCGFTEIVDENEGFILDASIISEARYDQI